jgi:hypothetical protein
VSFAEINAQIASRGGTWVKLTRKEHGTLAGAIVNVEVRDKVYDNKVVRVTSGKNEGKPRKEWVFTLKQEDGKTVKWAANENAQWAVSGAVEKGIQMVPGGHLQVKVVEDPPSTTKQAEYKAVYTPPTGNEGVFDEPTDVDEDEPPF